MNTRIDLSPLAPHANIGLQFSGGKDSLAVAYLLQPYWERLTFYHVDTGDLLPEVQSVVGDIERLVPRFVRIETNAREWTEAYGLPSDLVPTTCTPAGVLIGQSAQRIIDRYDCCATNIMAPMHRRMIADDVTLVIRGTKRADMARLPSEGGDTGMGYQLWLPIIDWSHDDVFAFLREKGVALPRLYADRVQAPECATCPAWWSEGRAAYLKAHYPLLNKIYRSRLDRVAREILPLVAALNAETAHP
jgi:3'-phosphoadenosine 5'-phosphosulfate sulfotransferase (PAPS reductase)/FAD synthetase